jgi:hypothetical protein
MKTTFYQDSDGRTRIIGTISEVLLLAVVAFILLSDITSVSVIAANVPSELSTKTESNKNTRLRVKHLQQGRMAQFGTGSAVVQGVGCEFR